MVTLICKLLTLGLLVSHLLTKFDDLSCNNNYDFSIHTYRLKFLAKLRLIKNIFLLDLLLLQFVLALYTQFHLPHNVLGIKRMEILRSKKNAIFSPFFVGFIGRHETSLSIL